MQILDSENLVVRVVMLVIVGVCVSLGACTDQLGTADGGSDASSDSQVKPDVVTSDASADATSDVCQPCKLGTSTVGNCCVQ